MFQTGGVSRSGLVLPFLSFFVLFGTFLIFSGFSRFVRGFSRFVLFLFLGLLTAPTRNSPERVCDTIWTFPEPLKTTFDMTTLIFSSGGCPSYPFYPLKRVPSYPFLAENPSSEGATKDHLSSKPPQGEPPGTKNQSGR